MAIAYPTVPVPFRWENGQCKACAAPESAAHAADCWVAETTDYIVERTIRAGLVPDVVDELTAWWLEVARAEAAAVVPKAIEYGATDLREIGRTMRFAAGGNGAGWTDAELAELGVYFYVVGKMARWTDAIADKRAVSDDTLHDIGVYIRMAQRIRAAGSWPGVRLNPKAETKENVNG